MVLFISQLHYTTFLVAMGAEPSVRLRLRSSRLGAEATVVSFLSEIALGTSILDLMTNLNAGF